jgi:S-(hydroxymethyl)glutathione dehydrogenase/alcohol dehydrogenase
VRRVRVGDVVVVADGPYCGECYMCLHGRADRCQMSSGGGGNPVVPVAPLSDGTPVVQENNEGGFGELMIPYMSGTACPCSTASARLSCP